MRSRFVNIHIRTTAGKPRVISRRRGAVKTTAGRGWKGATLVKTVKFSSENTEDFTISKEDVARNIKAGQDALARAMAIIITPGVKLKVSKGVPLFHADPARPGRLVRVLDGKRQYGIFVNGEFVETA